MAISGTAHPQRSFRVVRWNHKGPMVVLRE
jgi:hypothetical protein